MTESDDDVLAAVMSDVAELRSQVEELGGLRARVRDIAETVMELRAGIEDLAAPPAASAAQAWVWQDLDADAAEAAWTTLGDWMDGVLLSRYPEAVRVLHPCWYQHPAVLDALTALYTTWSAAYANPAATATDAAAWLERWLPSGVKQIREGLNSCRRDTHSEPAESASELAARLLGGDFKTYVATDLAARLPPAAPAS